MAERVFEVVIKGSQEGAAYRNVLHFRPEATVTDPNLIPHLLALAVAVGECFASALKPHLADEFVYVGTEARQIFPAVTDPQADATGAGVGGVGVGTLPSFNSMLVEKRTNGGGRRGRGRMFLPAPTEGDADGSSLAQDGIDHVTAFLTCLAGKFIGAGATADNLLVLLSKAEVAGGASIGNAVRDVTQLVPKTKVACLRRRKVGVGS
jgi:hypothetical protein